MSVGDKIRDYRKLKGLTQKQLGKLSGLHDSAISRLETGEQECTVEMADRIAKALGQSIEALVNSRSIEPADMHVKRIPVLDYVHAGKWHSINESRSESDISDFTYIDERDDVGPRSYALRIKGDSMEPEFHAGEVVIMDPDVIPDSGDYVVAVNGEDEPEAMFRKIRWLGRDASGNKPFELIALNPEYVTLRSDQTPLQIKATMMFQHKRRRKRNTS